MELITAVMTVVLVDEGRIALDDPIKQWIPGFGAAGKPKLDQHGDLLCGDAVAHVGRMTSHDLCRPLPVGLLLGPGG